MMEYVYRHFLTLSIYLSNSYSFYFFLDSIIPSQFKYLNIFIFKLNIFIFIISLIYAKVIEFFSDVILKKEDKQYLVYSLAKFFINTFINGVVMFFLLLIIIGKSGFGTPLSFPILSFIFFPFLLYAGFFFNFITSLYVFAKREDYIKNNPKIGSSTILLVRLMCFPIYLISFAPFVFISFHFLKSLI